MAGPNPHSAVPYEEFSPAAVATIALWKLAPMANSQTLQKTAKYHKGNGWST